MFKVCHLTHQQTVKTSNKCQVLNKCQISNRCRGISATRTNKRRASNKHRVSNKRPDFQSLGRWEPAASCDRRHHTGDIGFHFRCIYCDRTGERFWQNSQVIWSNI